MDPIEEMRQQVSEELQGSVTIVGKLSWCSLAKLLGGERKLAYCFSVHYHYRVDLQIFLLCSK